MHRLFPGAVPAEASGRLTESRFSVRVAKSGSACGPARRCIDRPVTQARARRHGAHGPAGPSRTVEPVRTVRADFAADTGQHWPAGLLLHGIEFHELQLLSRVRVCDIAVAGRLAVTCLHPFAGF